MRAMNIGTEVLEKLCARHIIAARVEQSVVVDRPPVAKGEQAPAADRRRPPTFTNAFDWDG
jgi:hypothetical protein